MATMAFAAAVALSRDVTLQEALSGVFGSVSLATWVFLLVPQLILNYKSGSADGISLAFLTVWLIGDITNLAGAIWAGLVPTVIALAVYFCFADFVLISQCLYYNHINAARKKRHLSTASAISEDEPLLARERSRDATGLPGSHRRRSSAREGEGPDGRRETLSKLLEDEDTPSGTSWLRNIVSVLAVVVVGTAGWAIAWQAGVWTPTPEDGGNPDAGQQQVAWGAEFLGYFSAVCYLGARIPQIIKNYREKTTEGLALLFFLLSLMGNLTYGAGILFHSLEKEYLTTNLPWLIGSLGTVIEDVFIFIQFRMYAAKQPATSTAAVE